MQNFYLATGVDLNISKCEKELGKVRFKNINIFILEKENL